MTCYDPGVSHDDDDVPAAKLLKDDLAARGGSSPPPAGATEVPLLERPETLRGELTIKSIDRAQLFRRKPTI